MNLIQVQLRSWEFSETGLNFSKPIVWNQGSNWKKFESLMINWGSNSINWKSGTKIKKACKFKVNIEFFAGTQSHKIKSLKSIRGAIEPIKTWGTKIAFYTLPSKSSRVTALFSHLNSAATPLQAQARHLRQPIAARNGQPKGCHSLL